MNAADKKKLAKLGVLLDQLAAELNPKVDHLQRVQETEFIRWDNRGAAYQMSGVGVIIEVMNNELESAVGAMCSTLGLLQDAAHHIRNALELANK
jgi:hypothetical protein